MMWATRTTLKRFETPFSANFLKMPQYQNPARSTTVTPVRCDAFQKAKAPLLLPKIPPWMLTVQRMTTSVNLGASTETVTLPCRPLAKHHRTR